MSDPSPDVIEGRLPDAIQAAIDAAKVAHNEAIDRAAMDLRNARRSAALDRIRHEVAAMQDRLLAAGFQPHRVQEFRAVIERHGSFLDVATTYAHHDYYINLTIGHGHKDRNPYRAEVRITQALIERDPNCVRNLTHILLMLKQGEEIQVHVDPGGTTMGLEYGDCLFGVRPPAPPADDPAPVDTVYDSTLDDGLGAQASSTAVDDTPAGDLPTEGATDAG